MMRSLCRIKGLLIANLVWTTIIFCMWGTRTQDHGTYEVNEADAKHIVSQSQHYKIVNTVKRMLREKYPDDEELISTYFEKELPVIYAVTPTHTRLTQKADLTRLCQTFLHVPNFFWIVVEDSDLKTDLVARFLKNCGLPYAHLNAKTPETVKMKDTDPRWLMPRGISQRNEGLQWIRQNVKPTAPAVLYFVDDDNTYSLRLFEEMRFTEEVSVWPVGIVGGLKFEGPICKNGVVTSFYTAWKPERPFPIDMAAFAVNIKLIFKYPDASFSNEVQRGYQESYFLSKITTRQKLEPRANDCSEILVWHTRTEKPILKQELKLEKIGKPSNPDIEV